MNQESFSIYKYEPSHVLPIVLAALVGLSLSGHIYQNFHYGFWRVTFFMFWGGTVFTVGWIARCVSAYNTSNVDLYIVQIVFILAGPPIYSAAEYSTLGRLMHYVPMHAPLNPNRVVYFFIYLGVAVESLTGAGASQLATAPRKGDADQYRVGITLVSVALVLQAVVECLFITMVALIHHRCARANMLPRNVRNLCIMLYGTSTLVLIRCIFRAVESFSSSSLTTCDGLCRVVNNHEWYLYVFEAAPMVLYTFWMNIMHPGRLLPRHPKQYLDIDGMTERLGPSWVDKRSKFATFVDPFDVKGAVQGIVNHEQFWLNGEQWPVASGGSFAMGTASNVNYRTRPVEVTSVKTSVKSTSVKSTSV